MNKKIKVLFHSYKAVFKYIFLKKQEPSIFDDIIEFERRELKNLFDSFGSDKSTHHDYEIIYSRILQKYRKDIRHVLEIGIGSTDPLIPQNMGPKGVSGASLKAWKEYFPNAQIIGADIDSKTFFEEHRIKCIHLDQLDTDNLESFSNSWRHKLDLIIVDGLHRSDAEINTLLALEKNLSLNGMIFIEDVTIKAALFIWRIFAIVLYKKFKIKIFKQKNGYLILVTKRN